MNTQQGHEYLSGTPGIERTSEPRDLREALLYAPAGRETRILERAAQLPLGKGAHLTVVSADVPSAQAHVRGEVSRHARAPHFLERGQALGWNVSIHPVHAHAPAQLEEQLIELIDHEGPELVLLPKERKSVRDALFGSFAERLARRLTTPLLIIDPKSRASSYERILVGVDFSELSNRAVEWALRLGGAQGQVELLHAYDTSYALVLRQSNAEADRLLSFYEEAHDQAETALEHFLEPYRRRGLQLRAHVKGGEPSVELCHCATSLPADLVVVGKQNDDGPEQPILGHVAGMTLRRVSCDILVVPGPTATTH